VHIHDDTYIKACAYGHNHTGPLISAGRKDAERRWGKKAYKRRGKFSIDDTYIKACARGSGNYRVNIGYDEGRISYLSSLCFIMSRR